MIHGIEGADMAFLEKLASRKELAKQGSVVNLQKDMRQMAGLLRLTVTVEIKKRPDSA